MGYRPFLYVGAVVLIFVFFYVRRKANEKVSGEQ